MDVYVGDFVGVQELELSPKKEKYFGWPRWELQNVARTHREFLALWYWPTTPKSLQGG
jgi:hypothetical protein